MIFNTDELLEELLKGDDPGKIAEEFTTLLNEAIQKAEEREAKEAAAKAKRRKEEKVYAVWLALMGCLKEFYPKVYDEELAMKNSAEVVEIFDSTYDEILPLIAMVKDTEKLLKKPVKKEKVKSYDSIYEFLKRNDLL